MNWEVVNDNDQAKIKVIGVGGAGGNAVIHMMNHKIQGVEFICANTAVSYTHLTLPTKA